MSNTEDNLFSSELKGRSNCVAKNASEDQDYKYDPLYYCRTCASKDAFFVPIFKGEGLNHQLNKKIEKYLPIHITRDDDLPLQLCYNCASTIIAWDALIVGCVEAEKKLRVLKSSCSKYDCMENMYESPQNEGEEPSVVGSDNIDSDDEPLIIKRLSCTKNFKSKKNGKKELIGENIKTQESFLQTENNADGEAKSVHGSIKKSTENETYSYTCGIRGTEIAQTDSDNSERENRNMDKSGYHCPLCLKTFFRSTSFCEDLYLHLQEGRTLMTGRSAANKCRVCDETIENMCELPEHLLSHVAIKLMSMSEGRGKAGGHRKKKKRRESLIGDASFKSTCEICGKTISRKYTMKRHLITHSGEKRFTCHHCGKQYAQESGLQRHMSVIHEGIRRYKCPICSKIFGSNFELKTHQDTHTDPRPFQCDQCGRTFVCQKHLYHHRKYHHTVNGLRQLCKICNKYFSSPGVLKRHHKVVHLGLKEFQCHICSVQLSTKQYLQEHLKIHTDERPEVCSFCGKTFQMAGNLRQHMKIHMEKTQICDVCGKGFTRRCHLLTHMGSHKGIEHPQCDVCEKRFLLKIDLEKHLKNDHGSKNLTLSNSSDGQEIILKEILVAEKSNEIKVESSTDDIIAHNNDDWNAIPKSWLEIISCKYCGKISCTSKHLKQHEQRKTCMKNFECNFCQQNFTKRINLEKHIKKHEREQCSNEDKRYTCGVCNKKFKFEDNGLSHEKLCGKVDSTFKCSVCGKRFETKTLADQHSTSHHKSCVCHMCGQSFNKPESLKQHIKTVHDEFKMVCHYCGREFTRKARLQEHLQHHTGQMDFTCHICGKGSTNAYSFSVHLATHTQETPFSCSFCPRTFKHMKYVYLHERAVHLKLKSGKTYIKPKKPGKNVAQRTCPLCNKTFKRESAMLIHKRSVHEGKNGYICKLCGKDFKYTYLLYVHKKKHHFPELCKYICQFCEKPFPVKTELEKHLRKHTGEKPYICNLCGKTYSFHGSLNMHMKTQHENKKNFKCDSCDASFNFRSHLARHMSAHEEKFPVKF